MEDASNIERLTEAASFKAREIYLSLVGLWLLALVANFWSHRVDAILAEIHREFMSNSAGVWWIGCTVQCVITIVGVFFHQTSLARFGIPALYGYWICLLVSGSWKLMSAIGVMGVPIGR